VSRGSPAIIFLAGPPRHRVFSSPDAPSKTQRTAPASIYCLAWMPGCLEKSSSTQVIHVLSGSRS